MPSTPDHTRLLAEIERREANVAIVQQTAPAPWDWTTRGVHMSGAVDGSVRDARRHSAIQGVLAGGVTQFLLDGDPADALRRYAHYRKVLERHVLDHSSPFCGACSWWEPGAGVEPAMGVPWPCDEIRDLAEALAIETGDAHAQHP